METGIELIAKERQEQIEKHGRSLEQDARLNTEHQLSFAAVCIAHPMADIIMYDAPDGWDETLFNKMRKKPYKERLIIAGALIAAEIDRLTQ